MKQSLLFDNKLFNFYNRHGNSATQSNNYDITNFHYYVQK